jgi:hypothetical protein
MAASANRQKDIFLQAIDLPSPAERTAFVAQACGSDEALRRQVEAMLKAYAAPDSFLEKPAAVLAFTIDSPDRAKHAASDECHLTEKPGTRIGPYKLLQQIGEGGMGVVFMAEQQEPVRRKVALKIIKPGMDSGQVIARFEAERQALAMMDHQNIARVLDAGTIGEKDEGGRMKDDPGRSDSSFLLHPFVVGLIPPSSFILSRPALLRHGAGARRADHQVLR